MRRKRGELRPDGLRFLCYTRAGGERWLTPRQWDANEAYQAKFRAENKAYYQKWHKDNYERRKGKIRARALRVYGINEREYEQMLLSQNGKCAICGKTDNGRRLAVDHCHSTGKVRGLLCNNCNRGIGHLKDSPRSAMKAAEYLWYHQLKASA